jgi:hypothetical protein
VPLIVGAGLGVGKDEHWTEPMEHNREELPLQAVQTHQRRRPLSFFPFGAFWQLS